MTDSYVVFDNTVIPYDPEVQNDDAPHMNMDRVALLYNIVESPQYPFWVQAGEYRVAVPPGKYYFMRLTLAELFYIADMNTPETNNSIRISYFRGRYGRNIEAATAASTKFAIVYSSLGLVCSDCRFFPLSRIQHAMGRMRWVQAPPAPFFPPSPYSALPPPPVAPRFVPPCLQDNGGMFTVVEATLEAQSGESL